MSELCNRSQIQNFLPARSESTLFATSEAIPIATSLLPGKPGLLLPVKPVSPLPAKSDSPLPACSQQSHIVGEVSCSQRSQFHSYQRRLNHHYQLAPSEARSTATGEASFTPTTEARFTATSMLPAKSDYQRGKLLPVKPVSPLPAMSDPPLPACSQQCEIVRQVRVSMSEGWNLACQSGKTECHSFKCGNFRVEKAWISVEKVSMSGFWDWAC